VDKMQVYNMLPVFLQNAACGIQGWKTNRNRYSATFWKALAEYESHMSWSYDQLIDYRDRRLQNMIHHCYETVPYYKRLFDEGGINPNSIRGLDDLHVLPILTKQIVKANYSSFISSAVSESYMKTAHTSGTTGSGFIFRTTQEALCEQWAVWWRYRRSLGIAFGTGNAVFGGQRIVPASQNEPPYWRRIEPANQWYFSSIHESESTLRSYYDFIEKKRIPWIHGYPSSIALLAAFMNDHRLHFSHVEYVTVGAENLLKNQLEQIREAFGVEPKQHYGTAEGVANFSENKEGKLIVDEDYAAVEFLDKGNTQKIVGSTLSNYAMPLLRWDLNDLARCEQLPEGTRIVTNLDGRSEDYILLPNGRRLGRLDHVFKDAMGVREAQIYQHSDYSVEIRIVKSERYGDSDENAIRKVLAEMLGEQVPISFSFVEEINKTENGKLRFVVSEIGQGDF